MYAGGGGLGTSHMFSFVYVAHPMKVTGMAWRKTSSFMPKYKRNHNLAYGVYMRGVKGWLVCVS